MRNFAIAVGVLSAFALAACGDNGNDNTDGGHDSAIDTPTAAVCGNGIVEPGEMCDDGNTTAGDGCSPTCTNEACGNGTVDPGEQCDDGNTTAGDGCSATCQTEVCGNGTIDPGEQCDDGNTTSGDGCSATCQLECGNGHVDPGEQCDDGNNVDGDGCDSNCTTTGCGNGVTTTGETCDDGNTTNGDGCSSACLAEPMEIEPNEDGTPSTGGDGTTGNDIDATAIANADTNGAFDASLGEVHILAHFDPEGDEDVFKITNTTALPQNVRLDVWNLAADQGWGMPCVDGQTAGGPPDYIDTVLRLYDSSVTSLDENDDRDGGNDRCSGLDHMLAPGDVIYAHVMMYGDDYGDTMTPPAPHYGVQVVFTPVICGDGIQAAGEECDDGNNVDGDGCESDCTLPYCGNGILDTGEACDDGNTADGDGCDSNCTITACGNGIVDPGEVCDDGNTTSGDGCSSTCQLEIAVTAEVEPNDTTADADGNAVQIAGTVLISGAMSSDTDLDTFKVTVATASVVSFQTMTDVIAQGCAADFVDVELLDSTGASMTNDDSAGLGSCGGITTYLVPGTYYIQVSGPAAQVYFLDVDFQGDVGVESEAAATTGVNDTTATASTNFGSTTDSFVYGDHEVVADLDYYAVTVPAGAGLRAQVVEGDWTDESCDDEDVDSRLYLYDQTGAPLTNNDDGGRGYCSYINGIGTDADGGAVNTTGTTQTWYLEVRSYHLTGTATSDMFKYHLSVLVK